MTARNIIRALDGRWHGSYGMALCPSHDDGKEPALKVCDDPKRPGEVLVHCFAGCDWRDVKDALRSRGLLPDRHGDQRGHDGGPRATDQRQAAALEIWRSSLPAANTAVETYLRARGLTLPIPSSIRFHPALKHGPTGQTFPAMVGAIQSPDRQITAIHRTFLLPDGKDKAQVPTPKMALAPFGSGAVRLGPVQPAIGLAEGVETALSAMQLWEIPVWAALGSRLDKVKLPVQVIEVQVFGDNGSEGQEVADKAIREFTSQGRRAVKRMPPEGFGDWNDVLRRQGS